MKKLHAILDALDRQRAWLPLLLRLVVGATFICHGYPKMKDYSATVEKMGQMQNLPLASLLAPLVPIVEFVGGIGLVAGLATRLCAFMISWVMVFAIFFMHWSEGFAANQVLKTRGWEWQALLLASCLVLMLGGPGVVSIDHAIRSRSQEPKR